MTFPVRAQPFVTPMRRGRLPALSRRHHPVDGPERPSGRNAPPSGITPSNIMSPARSQPRSRTEVRLGARAHTTRTSNRAHAPPSPQQLNPDNPDPALDTRPCTSKEMTEGIHLIRAGWNAGPGLMQRLGEAGGRLRRGIARRWGEASPTM
jgi:hypothetical protein